MTNVNMLATRTFGLKLVKREYTNVWGEILAIVLALLGALIVSALLIWTSGADMGEALKALFKGAFGNGNSFLETLVQATPLIFTGLAIVVAFRAKVWNIGAEGQFFAGAMAAAWVSMNLIDLPRPVLLTVIVFASLVAGAVWGFIPGLLKARLGTNEIITTVMMNYIITFILSYLLDGIWSAPGDYFMQTPSFAVTTHMPTFFNSRLHLGFVLAILLAGIVYILLWKMPLGYEIRAIGVNSLAAKYRGINIAKTIILVMVLSGAIAGLAGGSELTGLHHRLRLDISVGYGFTGIMIALLGRLNPFGVILAAIFFGALVNGSTAMQIFSGVPAALVFSVQGIVLIFLLVAEVLTKYQIRRVSHA
ncbi:MAG: ABC transporter permease [Chloroflexota bacterium]|nr:MAG: ABC transporter permease [Chloroflexota bacterium]